MHDYLLVWCDQRQPSLVLYSSADWLGKRSSALQDAMEMLSDSLVLVYVPIQTTRSRLMMVQQSATWLTHF